MLILSYLKKTQEVFDSFYPYCKDSVTVLLGELSLEVRTCTMAVSAYAEGLPTLR